MPNFDTKLFNDIMARDPASWTLEEKTFIDYVFCLTQNQGGQIQPYQTLPSGNKLLNPEQKTLISGADMAAKLIKNAGDRGQAWLDGLSKPKRDPIKSAIANEGKMETNWKKAQANHKWAKNLGKVTHADIVKVATKLGPGVFTDGIAARPDKINAAFTDLQPKLQAVSNAIQSMPSATEADNDKRVLENLHLMRKIGSG